jgi:hypothetical protein
MGLHISGAMTAPWWSERPEGDGGKRKELEHRLSACQPETLQRCAGCPGSPKPRRPKVGFRAFDLGSDLILSMVVGVV